MSDSHNAGFGKFVPGFDFLQNLAKSASQGLPQMPDMGNWVAPSLNVEDLQKRIDELKAVHFWLEQNSRALGATVQALEVQKMTLSTLKGMNFNIADVASAFKMKTPDPVQAEAPPPAPEKPAPAPAAKSARKSAKPAEAAAAGAAGLVDPMQLWGSLTKQFQQIAADAMKDVGKATAVDLTKNMASGLAKEALKTATGMAGAASKSIADGAGLMGAKGKKLVKKAAVRARK
ncbi:MAG: hypothetical protein RIS34_255 [Pseudomonadota bacterium]|jgi:hypothetical protein